MVEGGVTIVKYLLFLANLVLWVGGLSLIIIGSILQLKFDNVLDILGDERLATPIILVIIGYALHDSFRLGISNQLQLFECCGVTNSSYWLTFTTIPDSCCIEEMEGCARESAPLFEPGCIHSVEQWVLKNGAMVGGICAVLAAIQLVGVCFACCLSKSILKDFHDFYY